MFSTALGIHDFSACTVFVVAIYTLVHDLSPIQVSNFKTYTATSSRCPIFRFIFVFVTPIVAKLRHYSSVQVRVRPLQSGFQSRIEALSLASSHLHSSNPLCTWRRLISTSSLAERYTDQPSFQLTSNRLLPDIGACLISGKYNFHAKARSRPG